ncbi:tuberin, putative [Entamoeba invadens IP1]|uniref:Tuberin, putative n=1 Tax=Entamoeba invadens IP1 TaxID=370355 RepID=A0A0A1UCE4_ENTIV|nr:tuberin, putative [Entamoeba invadens IP1]ELP92922.1 tuberin, putative [Entamoeba invadens IP1]|eukprot:XP_004259693.1 tuberin, putative [Entamoeba invadens IP1]
MSNMTERDKKLKKKQAIIFEPKETAQSRVKACISLMELLNEEEFHSLIILEKQKFSAFLVDVSNYMQLHTKKGRISVPLKEAVLHVRIIERIIFVFNYTDICVFELFSKFFMNYLKIDTNEQLREQSFLVLIKAVVHYKYQKDLVDLFVKSLNLNTIYNSNSLPSLGTGYGENLFCPNEGEIDQKFASLKMLNNFFTEFKKPDDYDSLFPLLEVILSWTYPSFAKKVGYKYIEENPSCGVEEPSGTVIQTTLNMLKDLVNSTVSKQLRTRDNLLMFFQFFYQKALALPPTDETISIVLVTISSMIELFITNVFTYKNTENVQKIQLFIISALKPFCEKTIFTGSPVKAKELTLNIKKELQKFGKANISEELKVEIIKTTLFAIEWFVSANFGDSITSYVDLLFVLFLNWNRGAEDWELLRTSMEKHFGNPFVIAQIKSKLLHCSRLVLRDYYSKLLLENTDDVIVSNKKVLRSTHLDNLEDVFIAPSFEDKFMNDFPDLASESGLNVFNLVFSLLSKINDIPKDIHYDCAIKTLYDIFIIFVKAETKLYRLHVESQPNHPVLINIFGSLFFNALKLEISPQSYELCFRGICKIVNRPYVKYPLEVYNNLYEISLKALEVIPTVVMEELYDVLFNQLPGWQILVFPLLEKFTSIKAEDFKESQNINRDCQVVLLLNSLVSAKETSPHLERVLTTNGFEKSDFDALLVKSYTNMLTVLTQKQSQEMMIYGVVCAILYSRIRKIQSDITSLLQILFDKICDKEEDIYRTVSESVGVLAFFSDYFNEDDVRLILTNVLNKVQSTEIASENIACLFDALTNWAFSPSGIFVKSLTPELSVLMLNTVSYAMNLPRPQHSADPAVNIVHVLLKCRNIIQTFMNAFGFVPSEHGSDKYMYQGVEGGDVSWYACGHTIMSIEKGSTEEFCKIILRNAAGKTCWGVQSATVLEDLELASEELKQRVKIQDIVKGYPNQEVKDRKVKLGQNVLREMYEITLKEEGQILSWGIPGGIEEDAYTDELELMGKSVQSIESDMKELGSAIQGPNEEKKVKLEVDTTKLQIQSMLCAVENIDEMGKVNKRVVPLNPSDKFKILLSNLDKSSVRPFHKIGLVYVQKGQTDQLDILKNEGASDEYQEFAEGLGWTVDMKKHNGFIGGLDKVFCTTGEKIRYYSDSSKEVVFHDVVLIPTQADDEQQIVKKRHVGNDYVHIIWNEDGEYSPYTISSHFNSAHIVVNPLGKGMYKIRIWRKPNVRLFGPLMDGMVITKKLLPSLVRETAVNANYCCSLNMSPDDYLKPYLRRSTLIKEIIEKNDPFEKASYFNTLTTVTNPQVVSELGKK